MDQSRIETVGRHRYLICYYNRIRKNYDEVITQAMERHGVTEKVTVFCYPERKQPNDE